MKRYGYLLKKVFGHKKILLVIILAEVINVGLSALLPYLYKIQIDQLQARGRDMFVLAIVAHFVLIVMDRMIVQRMKSVMDVKFYSRLRIIMQKEVWKKMATLDYGFFENNRYRRLINRVAYADDILRDFVKAAMGGFSAILSIVSVIPIMGLIDIKLVPLVIIVTALEMVLNEIAQKQDMVIRMQQDKLRDQHWRADVLLTHDLHRLRLAGGGAIEKLSKEHEEMMLQKEKLDLRSSTSTQNINSVSFGLKQFVELGVSVYLGMSVIGGVISLGTYTMTISYLFRLMASFSSLAKIAKDWQVVDVQMDQYDFFMKIESRVRSGGLDAQAETKKSEWKISLDNTYFKYPDFSGEEKRYVQMMINKISGILKNRMAFSLKRDLEDLAEQVKELDNSEPKGEVLKGVSMQIESGKIVALLGRNGAGKTTITQLMLRSYEPTQGKIWLNHNEISEYDTASILTSTAVIQQRPFVMEGYSVRDNLLLGARENTNDKAIWKVLDELGIKKVIQNLPRGLDSIIDEDAKLSGGERQMMVVARIILQKRRFVIFDEGVNQLDIERENLVLRQLKKMAMEGCGVLFITHRITTAKKADWIYFLKDGKICEEGTHDRLLKTRGEYAKFWNMQVSDDV